MSTQTESTRLLTVEPGQVVRFLNSPPEITFAHNIPVPRTLRQRLAAWFRAEWAGLGDTWADPADHARRNAK